MGEKRSKEEIIVQILTACREKSSKTRILHIANLNSRNVTSFLNQMVESGLIAIEPGEVPQYQITPKGLEMLESLRGILKQIGSINSRK